VVWLSDEAGFIECARSVGKRVLCWKSALVVHHHDCDGIASGGVAANALRNAGITFQTMVLPRLDAFGAQAAAQKARELGKGTNIVFTDLGSGQLALLAPLLEEFEIGVIDHHVPQIELKHDSFVHANPMLFGFDGGVAASAATTAYFCFRDYCKGLEQFGVVGAVGDIQAAQGLQQLNAVMLQDGVASGVVAKKMDLKMFGRYSRDLASFLAYSAEPFLPGLSGSLKKCAEFLYDNSIDTNKDGKWLRYKDLTGEQQKQLVSALANYLAEKGTEKEVIASLVGEVYEFPKESPETELYDSSDFSTLLNAVGRHEQAALGIRVCLKETGALEQARGVLEFHRRMISEGINFARSNCNDVGAFYLVDARGVIGDTIIGSVIGNFFSSGIVPRTKPIVGLSKEGENISKASSRGCKKLIEAGLDLNIAMRTSAEFVGGLGGGHKIAAGASFPAGKEAGFLLKVKQELLAQKVSV